MPANAVQLNTILGVLESNPGSRFDIADPSKWKVQFGGAEGNLDVISVWKEEAGGEKKLLRVSREAIDDARRHEVDFTDVVLARTVRRRHSRTRGAGLMEMMLLLVLMALGLVVYSHWMYEEYVKQATQRTIDGFQVLMEGLFAYRLDNPGRWTNDFTLIDDYVPQLHVVDRKSVV